MFRLGTTNERCMGKLCEKGKCMYRIKGTRKKEKLMKVTKKTLKMWGK